MLHFSLMSVPPVQILAVIDTSQIARREKLTGIFAAANARKWTVKPVTKSISEAEIKELFKSRRPRGVIIDGFEPPVKLPRRFLKGVATVMLDGPSTRRHNLTAVNHDNSATASFAASVLAKLRGESFAIVLPEKNNYYARTRAEAFSRTIAELTGKTAVKLTADQRLGEKLRRLPRPTALLAVTDAIGQQVIEAAAASGIAVPEELAVLGIDNDELVCENCSPSLSSIEPDFRRGGQLAAEKLAALIAGRDPGEVPSSYSYRTLVVRHSSLRLAYDSRAIAAALEYIRLNATFGIKAKDVIADSSLPKSTLELHFRRATGKSIAAVIRETRLEAVKRLLAGSKKPLSEVAVECGYLNSNHLKNAFKRATGLTLSRYRRSYQ